MQWIDIECGNKRDLELKRRCKSVNIDYIISIIISILGSSLITLVLSTFIFIPKQEK